MDFMMLLTPVLNSVGGLATRLVGDGVAARRHDRREHEQRLLLVRAATPAQQQLARFNEAIGIVTAAPVAQTLSVVATWCDCDGIAALQSLRDGAVPLTTTMLCRFAQRAGLSVRWLVDGDGAPYERHLEDFASCVDALIAAPQLLYVRADGEQGRCFVATVVGTRVEVVTRGIHVSRCVGDTGAGYLRALLQLVGARGERCDRSLDLSENEWCAIYDGNIAAETLLRHHATGWHLAFASAHAAEDEDPRTRDARRIALGTRAWLLDSETASMLLPAMASSRSSRRR
jgi:hypothetical protein